MLLMFDGLNLIVAEAGFSAGIEKACNSECGITLNGYLRSKNKNKKIISLGVKRVSK